VAREACCEERTRAVRITRACGSLPTRTAAATAPGRSPAKRERELLRLPLHALDADTIQ
jgi:hypothetical protein